MEKLSKKDDLIDRIFQIEWHEGEEDEVTLHPAGGVCCYGVQLVDRILYELGHSVGFIVEREFHSVDELKVRIYRHDDLLCVQVIDDKWAPECSGWYLVDGKWSRVVCRLDS